MKKVDWKSQEIDNYIWQLRIEEHANDLHDIGDHVVADDEFWL